MLKRTKGRLLISLLVVTGLAGTLNNNSVTQSERKQALTLLKETKSALIKEVQGLSEAQLNFSTSTHQQSIKNNLFLLAWTEKKLWENFNEAMKLPANPEKRLEINLTDQKVLQLAQNNRINTLGTNTFKQANAPWKTANAAIATYKILRNEHIKYMKSSTEDLRNHVISTTAGSLDCYQYILILGAESYRLTEQIKELKANPDFPVE